MNATLTALSCLLSFFLPRYVAHSFGEFISFAQVDFLCPGYESGVRLLDDERRDAPKVIPVGHPVFLVESRKVDRS